jgi:hypothetical protein
MILNEDGSLNDKGKKKRKCIKYDPSIAQDGK